MFNGGVTETRKVAALSQIYNRPLSDAGGATYFSMHHIAAYKNATRVECHFKSEYMEQVLFPKAPRPEKGKLRIPEAPGFGIEVDRGALKDSEVRL
jgi:L-alanine-DL-glutamate epimerase-like enolase superfamily enzyme